MEVMKEYHAIVSNNHTVLCTVLCTWCKSNTAQLWVLGRYRN